MLAPLLLSLICLVLLGLSIHLFFRGVRQTGIERVMDRLAQGQPQLELQRPAGVAWTARSCGQAWGAQPSAWGSGCCSGACRY